jgi:apolipoprotein D and lipocalin family protein
MNRIACWFVAATLLLAGASMAQEVEAVDSVDLDRYAGKWYEIARFPNRFQEDCAGNVTADYARREDGRLDVINRCRAADGSTNEAAGVARIPNPENKAKLEVRFAPDWLSWLPMVWSDYWIIDLAPDYSSAAVGEPEREYLWILSRTPTLPEETYQDIVNRLTEQGFDTARLRKTKQE